MSRCPFGQGFDFTDPDLLLAGMPVSEFAELRKTAPVWWNEQPAGSTTTRRRTPGCASSCPGFHTPRGRRPRGEARQGGSRNRRDGHGEGEFTFFVILLAVAGNETTRNAMTHSMNAFFDNPDQWELFKRESPETAVDEIIRWATPVHASSEPHWQTTTSAASRSGRDNGPARSTAQPTSTKPSSTNHSSSTSYEIQTRTWPSVAMARTIASAPTWHAWRSSS